FYYEENKSFIKNDNFITNSRTNDELWNSKLKKFNKFKIGLFWQGSKNYVGDIRRSIPLNKFDKIIKNKKINVISLQKGDGTNQIKENKYEKYIIEYSKDLDNTEDAYKDTLSILKNIDLLITSDSSVAHLAGTINKKTWLLLCYNPDWRWYIQNKSNSFYDSIKIFQQNKFGDWDNVFKSVETELELLLNNN
ncbi:hypothetical protein N9U51_03515, partial [Candidatus Pelagibacter sp.]|nr:hypothetical protein [Candidatus Pelagibacter sp.]